MRPRAVICQASPPAGGTLLTPLKSPPRRARPSARAPMRRVRLASIYPASPRCLLAPPDFCCSTFPTPNPRKRRWSSPGSLKHRRLSRGFPSATSPNPMHLPRRRLPYIKPCWHRSRPKAPRRTKRRPRWIAWLLLPIGCRRVRMPPRPALRRGSPPHKLSLLPCQHRPLRTWLARQRRKPGKPVPVPIPPAQKPARPPHPPQRLLIVQPRPQVKPAKPPVRPPVRPNRHQRLQPSQLRPPPVQRLPQPTECRPDSTEWPLPPM